MKMNVGSSSCSSSFSLQQPIRASEESSSIKEDDNNDTYFSEDVLLEIFLGLPLNTIFKFRCVSKLWFFLLSNPFFITRWTSLFTPWTLFYQLDRPVNESVSIASPNFNPKFISNHDGFSFRFLYLKSSPYPYSKELQEEKIYLLGSSNGLVLCSTTKYYQRKYYVCNPLTKKWVLLPRSSHHYADRLVIHGFFCESSSSSSSLTTRSTYKVVRVPLFSDPTSKFDLEIFSSDMGKWKIHRVCFPQRITRHSSLRSSSNVVTRNEFLYWIHGGNRMIAYDPNNNNNKNGGHQCRLIDLPLEVREDDYGCLGETEGFICYSQCQSGQLSVWVFEENFSRRWSSWCRVHEIQIKDMLAENCEDWFMDLDSHNTVNLIPLAFNPVDRNVVILGFGTSFIFAYNIRSRRLKLLSRDSFYYSNSSGVLPFVLDPWLTAL